MAGHRDSVQSSDFSSTANALVNLIPAPPLSVATGVVKSWLILMVTAHRPLGLNCAHLGPVGGNPSCLCYSASGLLVSQATWAPGRSLFTPRPSRVQATVWFTELRGVYLGIWLLGQNHPHLEAHNQQPSFPAQGTRHLGEEPRLFSRRAEASQCWLLPHSKSTQGTPPPNLSLPMLDDAHRPSYTARALGCPTMVASTMLTYEPFISVLEAMQVAF